MSVLVRLANEATGPDGLYPIEAVHYRPMTMRRKQRESFSFALPELPEPEPRDGYDRALFGSSAGSVYYYERTSADEEAGTEAGPWMLLYEPIQRAQIDRELAARTLFSYDFGAISATEEDGTSTEAGVRQLQMRDVWDRTNWSNLLETAKEQIDAGNGTQPAATPIRTAGNARVHVTNNEARDALVALRGWGAAMLAHAWGLKDQIAQASTPADLDAIDVTAGWPI